MEQQRLLCLLLPYYVQQTIGISPIPILIGIAMAASLALSSPKASFSNTLVMTAGEYRPKDFALLGVSLQVFVGIVLIIAIPMFFPILIVRILSFVYVSCVIKKKQISIYRMFVVGGIHHGCR